MDFGTLLDTAQKNDQSSKSGASYYKTKFEPPKKENKSKTLSSNIIKFLAKKEQEERIKAEESRRKRDELVASRDQKATNKIKKMLKVIKSANKSVLEEAVDNDNTAVTINGPDQPDEDDYGYVSQEASAFYSKMMEKYKGVPDEDKKFAASKKAVSHDLSGTKDRVKAAILRHQEEEAQPHRRKRRTHDSGDTSRGVSPPQKYDPSKEQDEKKKDEKPKPRRPAPPPLDFNELLKIAEKKQFEPVVIETKKPENVDEAERLMTKRQKREYEEQKASRESRLKRQQEREQGSLSEKKNTKKVNNDSQVNSGKPINPLSIRIPKIGDKANASNPSRPESARGQDPASKNKIFSADKQKSVSYQKSDSFKKDGPKSVEKKTDFNKNIKQPLQRPSNQTLIQKSIKNQRDVEEKPSSSRIPQHNSKDRDVVKENSQRGIPPEKKVSGNNGHRTLPISNESRVISKNLQSPINLKDRPQTTLQPKIKANPDGSSLKKLPSDIKNRPSSNVITGKNPLTHDPRKIPSGSNGKSCEAGRAPLQKKPNPQMNAKDNQGPSNKKTGLTKPDNKTVPVRQFPPTDVKGVRQFPPADVKGVRQFPPADVKKSRPFPPTDVRRPQQLQRPDGRPRPNKPPPSKRKIMDDDSEYDSELDDFIDDGPEDRNDYSKYIKEIFGYDKSRYRDADEDDRNMESNFSQVMREEYISKKIGILEDLEDMKMEALEKKKKQQKRRRIED